MDAIGIINLVITLLFFLCSGYQLVYLLIPFIIKEKPCKKNEPHRITVLIAARNEEAVIGQLIDSVKNQDYPGELVKICVIADNCSDSTAHIARSKGATVFEREDKLRVGKGYALDFALKRLLAEDDAEAYLVLDADNLLKRNFITEINRYFSSGYEVVTGYRNTKNFSDNWISAGYALWFLRESQFVNRPRQRLGTCSVVMGTGFLFSRKIAEEMGGWKYHGLSEDTDFSMDRICRGKMIGYCESAMLYDEQPVSFSQSWRQRLRWIRGSFEMFKKHGAGLIKGIFKGSWSCWDALAQNLSAFFLVLFATLANALSFAVALIRGAPLMPTLKSVLFAVIWGYCALFFMGLVTALGEWKKIKAPAYKKILAIFTFPVYIATNIPIAFVALFRKAEWKPIRHTRSVTDDQINGK